jgi:hypothetical protein
MDAALLALLWAKAETPNVNPIPVASRCARKLQFFGIISPD